MFISPATRPALLRQSPQFLPYLLHGGVSHSLVLATAGKAMKKISQNMVIELGFNQPKMMDFRGILI